MGARHRAHWALVGFAEPELDEGWGWGERVGLEWGRGLGVGHDEGLQKSRAREGVAGGPQDWVGHPQRVPLFPRKHRRRRGIEAAGVQLSLLKTGTLGK